MVTVQESEEVLRAEPAFRCVEATEGEIEFEVDVDVDLDWQSDDDEGETRGDNA